METIIHPDAIAAMDDMRDCDLTDAELIAASHAAVDRIQHRLATEPMTEATRRALEQAAEDHEQQIALIEDAAERRADEVVQKFVRDGAVFLLVLLAALLAALVMATAQKVQ